MPKSAGQKTKLLCLAKILLEETDEAHSLSLSELSEKLLANGIHAERKSLYSDLEELSLFGLNVECVRAKGVSYYIGQRRFELAELKLLVDAVQSSRFLTKKKSAELIRKLGELTSVHEARSLSRQVYVANRVKTMNESIYYSVDALHAAIAQNKKISFLYFQWDAEKKQVLRRGGERYIVSPFALSWNDENYYLIGFDEKESAVRHYRVDKMLRIETLSANRSGAEVFSEFDMSIYENRLFGMFGGKSVRASLWCEESLVGVILDRFGADTVLMRKNGGVCASVLVTESPLFFGWVAGFGEDMRILAPQSLADAYRAHLNHILSSFSFEKEKEAKENS